MPPIRDVRAVPVDVPLSEPFAIAGGAPSVARNVFVRIELADGAAGYGEAAPFEAVSGETQRSTLAALTRAAPALLGREATAWRGLRALMPAEPAARCALEQALLAALARSAGISLLSYLGGPPGTATLRTDITIPAGSVGHAVSAARRAAAAGFDTVKIKAGAAGWETDAERVRAVHDAEPGLRLVVDANCGYTLEEARRFLGRLGGVPLALFEQPVAPGALRDLAALAADAPVCADESVRSPADALRVAELGGIAALNVKLMKFGVIDALDVVAIARAAGIACMIGGMIETPLSMSFSAALAAADPAVFRYVDLDTPLFMPAGAVPAPLAYAGAELTLRPEPVDPAAWFAPAD